MLAQRGFLESRLLILLQSWRLQDVVWTLDLADVAFD